jgi:hypothetical protein
MKHLILLLSFSSIVYTQEISSFRDKKEVFLGLNYNAYYGFNGGFTKQIEQNKKIYYRLEIQNTKRYYINSWTDNNDEFWYKDLTINSVLINNMFSYRFYQKRNDRFYFELGSYLGINLWQQKKGKTVELEGFYQYKTKDFKKTYILLPNDLGIHFGFGTRLSKHILLKPEMRLGVWSFDRMFEGDNILELIFSNLSGSLNFNIAYLF